MKKLNLGLIGYGVVGSGVVKILNERKNFIKKKFNAELNIKTICDRSIHKKKVPGSRKILLTTSYRKVIEDKDIDVVIELIGGLDPAEQIMFGALKNGKHVVTANKELLAHKGKELFSEAIKRRRNIYFEAAVCAGIPLISSITEGLAGNRFNGLYGIINGTCNFILSEMANDRCSFAYALKEAQRRGYAESNPTLDISGMDTAHKLTILVYLALGRFIKIKDIHVEGIEQISSLDIDYAQSVHHVIKLLAIAKKEHKKLELRVQPTLIHRRHPLASVNGIFNAIFLNTDPVGDILLYGQGAGQMPAAAGVVSDLINLASRDGGDAIIRTGSLSRELSKIRLRKIDEIETEYYIRLQVLDQPGVLSQISGILGRHDVSIASLTQKGRSRSAGVPIIMTTHEAKERMVRLALEKIGRLSCIKDKPVAIRMEKF